MLMVGALKRGLMLSDFNDMTIGMIIDYISTYNDIYFKDENEPVEATKEDIDKFFS